MNLLKKGMLFLFAATLFVACSDDDDDAVVTPVTPEEPVNNHPLAGTSWSLKADAGSLAVGPAPDNLTWWSNSADDVTTRACLFDDVVEFKADNTLSISLGSDTWLEPWQGQDPEGCGAAIAPHVSNDTHTWSADTSTVTVVGDGAFLGLAKVHNSGEDGNPADDTITYNYVLDGDTLTLSVTGGWHPEANATWAFVYSKN